MSVRKTKCRMDIRELANQNRQRHACEKLAKLRERWDD